MTYSKPSYLSRLFEDSFSPNMTGYFIGYSENREIPWGHFYPEEEVSGMGKKGITPTFAEVLLEKKS